MKKILLYTCLIGLVATSCKKDDVAETYQEPADIAIQNSYDDQAIQKFLDNNYLDSNGNIKPVIANDTASANHPKLSAIPEKQVLPSGVIIIPRAGHQPTPGTTVGNTDKLTMIMTSSSYVAANLNGSVDFNGGTVFYNNITDATMVKDPAFYYVKKINVTPSTTYDRSYFEMEGFQEGIRKFKAFNQPDAANYDLQGVIIVPSRAAFARDNYYTGYSTISLRNRSFVFNFQIYRSEARPSADE
jgi:hypothetical protein